MIANYIKWLIEIEKYDSVLEHALSQEKINRIDKLVRSSGVKLLLKEFNDNVVNLKKSLTGLNFDNIAFRKTEDDKHKDIFVVDYNNKEVDDYIKNIIDIGKKTEILSDNDYLFYPQIEIDKRYFNKIDIVDGISNMIRGIGVGKKIYKKLIKTYGFVSSINIYADPSMESSMVWHSLATDEEIYIFSNNENFIAFWKDFDGKKIILELEKYYKYGADNPQFDDDFIFKYEDLLKNSEILRDIYKN